MADPLSIAASIAGLSQFAAAIFHALIKYSKSAANAKTMVQNLAMEMRNLSGLLHSLSLLSTALEESGDKPTAFQDSQVALWRQTFSKIEKAVEKAERDLQGNRLESTLRRLRWPLSQEEIEKLLDELSRHKETIVLALTTDTLDKLIENLGLQRKSQASIQEMRDSLEQLRDIQSRLKLNQKRQQIIDFFLQVNPQSNFQTSLQLRQQDTGLWLINSHGFTKWKTIENSKMWLSGIPGSGKTVICASIIEESLQQCSETTALAFFFCDYKNPQSHQLTNVLSALGVQLALQKRAAFDLLEAYYQKLHPEHGMRRDPEASHLSSLIQQMAETFQKVFVIVDGLDECGEHTSEVVRAVKTFAEESHNVSMALLSRNELGIHEELAEGFDHIEIAAHTEDIELFVDAQMATRKQLRNLEPTLSKDVRHALVEGAQGMFRWVVCQLDYIASLPNARRRQALKGLPPTLNETYERILNQILHQSGNTSTNDIIQKALQWICYEGTKITIAELCEAVSLQESKDSISAEDLIEEDEISRYCSSLVRKSYDGSSFELAHFTVKEYLQSIEINSSLGLFRYDENEASQSLASAALRFLMFPEFGDRPTPDASQLIKMDRRVKKHPFYRIAAMVWPRAYSGGANSKLTELVAKFLTQPMAVRYQNWLLQYLRHLDRYADEKDELFGLTITFALGRDLSTLHVAAALAMPEICRWLIESGADPRGVSRFGSPLRCALTGPKVFDYHDVTGIQYSGFLGIFSDDIAETIQVLLEHGAYSASMWTGPSVISMALEVCMLHKNAAPLLPLLQDAETLKVFAKEHLYDLTKWDYNDELVHEIFQAILDMEEMTQHPQWWELIDHVETEILRQGKWGEYEHKTMSISAAKIPDADFHLAVKSAAINDDIDGMLEMLRDPRFGKYGLRDQSTGLSALHVAAQERSCCTMRVLLDSAFDFHLTDDNGRSPLHHCYWDYQVEALEILLENAFSSTDADKSGYTVWHLAARWGSTEILKGLLRQNDIVADALKMRSKDGRTPLAEALAESKEEAAILLLQYCSSDPEYFQSDVPLIHRTAAIGSRNLFYRLAEKYSSPADIAPDGSTPLHFVNASIEPAFLESLVQRYDLEHARNDGRTAFEIVLSRARDSHQGYSGRKRESLKSSVIEALLPKAHTLMTLLPKTHTLVTSVAPRHVWEYFCQELVENWPEDTLASILHVNVLSVLIKADVLHTYEKLKNRPAVTPLCHSLLQLSESIFRQNWVSVLVEKTFSVPDKPDSVLGSPAVIATLKKAILLDVPKLATLLLQHGVSVRVKENGISPIEQSCVCGGLEIFQQMLKVDDTAIDNDVENSDMDFFRLLVAYNRPSAYQKTKHFLASGADPNTVCRGGVPVVILAAIYANFDVVDLLLDCGADLYAKSLEGLDMAKAAAIHGNLEMIRQVQSGDSGEKYNWESRAVFLYRSQSGGLLATTSPIAISSTLPPSMVTLKLCDICLIGH